jgi:hypothetical protein
MVSGPRRESGLVAWACSFERRVACRGLVLIMRRICSRPATRQYGRRRYVTVSIRSPTRQNPSRIAQPAGTVNARSISAAAERKPWLLANDREERQHHEPVAWKWPLLTGVHTRRKCQPRRMRVRGRWRAERERYQGADGGGGGRSMWGTCCAAVTRAVPPGQAADFIGRKAGPAPNKGRATRCRRWRAARRRRCRAGATETAAVTQVRCDSNTSRGVMECPLRQRACTSPRMQRILGCATNLFLKIC